MYHILWLLRPRVPFTVDRVRRAHTIGKRPETGPTIIISTKRNLEIALQFPSTSAGIKLRVRYSVQFSGLTYWRVDELIISPCTVSTAANAVFTVYREPAYKQSWEPGIIFRFRQVPIYNSNKSPTWCNNFPVYYRDVYLQFNMFRAFSHPSSGTQWLQQQPLVLPSYLGDSRAVFVVGPARPRTQHGYHHDTKVKTRGCYCSRWAPDDGQENARNMLSCK